MTVTATYNADLARVEVAATDAFSATTITIDRSTDGVRWTAVRGGVDLPAGAAQVDDYEFEPNVLVTYRARSYSAVGALLGTQTDTETPTIDRVWLKSVARPFLNMKITVEDYAPITRASRSGVFEIPGRSFPVRVGDAAGSRAWALDVLTSTLVEARSLEYLVASGDVVHVQVPPAYDIPGGYVGLGDMSLSRVSRRLSDVRRRFALPMRQVAPPAPTVVGYTATWAGIIAEFGTWADVVAAFPTWADVMEYVSDPSTVIVP